MLDVTCACMYPYFVVKENDTQYGILWYESMTVNVRCNDESIQVNNF